MYGFTQRSGAGVVRDQARRTGYVRAGLQLHHVSAMQDARLHQRHWIVGQADLRYQGLAAVGLSLLTFGGPRLLLFFRRPQAHHQ
jgi:hypothetical protein